MRVNEKMRKALSILLCLCMLLQNAPVMAFAVTTDNLCEHHTEHTAECGYREGSAGSACTHEHSEDCYAILDCKHTCGDECDDPCTHECTVENGCITMELDCHHVHGDCGYSEGTAEVPCGHVHNESCGYVEAVVGNPCANAETDPECDHSGDCGYVAAVEGQPCGHTACDDTCGYAPATEGTPCTHVCEVKVDSDDSCYKLLCSHKDGGHDDACGYVAAVEAHDCHYECAECAAALTAEDDADPTTEATTEPSTEATEPATEATEPAPVCDCGTDDGLIHATTCAVYVAPENPVCYCAEKCTEVNVWCDVCGFDYTACTGTDTAALYEDTTYPYAVVDTEAGTLTIDGTLGGKTTATEEDITALVEQLKAYVDSGNTTIIVTGSKPAMIEVSGLTITAIGEAIYRLSLDDSYNGKIDLILPDVTEIIDKEFYSAQALNSITLPKVTKLGSLAFYGTQYLRIITFGSVLTEVNETGGVMFAYVGNKVGGCDLILNCGQMNESSVPVPDLTINTWGYENKFKSITLTHTGGTATCSELAKCEVCGTEYGEVGAHTAEPTYVPNAGDSTQHDATYSCCGATVTEAHTMNVTTGKCVCGADMTAIATVTDGTNTYYAADAATLNQAVTAILETGSRTFTVELPADAEAGMITTIRRAICDTEGVADGSIHLTLKGVTTIPGTTNWDGVAFGPRNAQWDENNVEIVSHEEVTQLASVNLPDVTEIGAQAFYFCENLVTVSAPKAQTIGAQALGYTALTSVEFPELTTIPTDMFSGTWTLSSAKFPKVTTIEQGGLLVGAKFMPENNPTPFPLELTAEGDITFNGSNHFNIASQNYSGKVDLVLCCDKKDDVTFQEDGSATWQVREDLSYTFKSITFKHSYVNGKCTACGEDCTHTGGTATCTTLAVCDTCGVSYGAVDTTNHDSSVECENGFCPNGCYEPAILNAAGYYEIDNAGKLFWFAQQVNVKGNREIKGVLTANIDLENKPWTPIGVTGEENNNFRGVFDGQNYTIKGLYVEGSENGVGFFGEVRTGTVKNFTIYGNVVVNTEVDYVGGVIGSICGLNSTDHGLERNGAIIQNITSFVNVTAKVHGIGMIGGFVGYANHQSLIEKCAWYGTFDAGEYHVDSGAGGFIGKIQENTSEVTIRNCGAYGTIKTGYEKNSYNNYATIYMGGFLSFSNTNAQTTLENCLFAGRFERGANLTDQAFLGAFGTLRSVNAIKNCYYLGDDGLEAVHSDSNLKPGSDNVEITSVTGEELRNNTIATQLGDHWMQDVHYPIPKDTKAHSDSATYTYTDNGDGTHKATCNECGYEETSRPHTIENHACTDCGAMEIVVSFDAGDYEWKTGDTLYFCRVSGDNEWEEYAFTATVAGDGTVTWTPDRTLYWDGTGEHKLVVIYPDTGYVWDTWYVDEDQATPETLRKNDRLDAIWSGNPTTDTITFNLKHRMAKVTVNYEIKEDVAATVSNAEIYSLTQYLLFDIDTLERKDVAWEEGDDCWINSYHNGNQFTAFVSPDAYAADGNFIKITLSDGSVREVKMNKAVTFEEGAEYTYTVVITADGAYLTCADECTFEYTDNGDGTHTATCSKCGYAVTEEHTLLTYSASGNVITGSCSKCPAVGTATITAENTTYKGTAQETATVAYSEGWNSGELTVSYVNNVNAGTATASITVGEATASVEFTIAKAEIDGETLINPEFAKGLIYNGTAQALVTKTGSVDGGYIVYSLSIDGEYTTTIPVATEAGNYRVYWTIECDENHYVDGTPGSRRVTIAKANPEYTVPTGLTATYGDTLAKVELPTGWAWKDAETTSVGNAGTRTFKALYNPDSNNYNTVEADVTVEVAKANPEYTVPTGLTATYGNTLADVELPTGWAWNDAESTSVGNAGTRTFKALYNPDSNNYNTVEADVTIEVAKALIDIYTDNLINPEFAENLVYNGTAQALVTNSGSIDGGYIVFSLNPDGEYTTEIPVATEAGEYVVFYRIEGDENHYWEGSSAFEAVTIAKANPEYTVPTGLTATYGDTLAKVELPTGWAWKDAETTSVGNAGKRTFKALYNPDSNNYNTVEADVTVEVAKADPEYTVPTGLTATYSDTLADVELPAGWTWKDAETTSVGNAGTRTFKAVFTPADTVNYNTVEADVTIEVAKAEIDGSTLINPEFAKGLIYNGTAQALVTKTGSVDGGYIVYSLSIDGEYTTTIPVATEAGNYGVYWTIECDENHYIDGTPGSSRVTIAAKDASNATVTLDDTSVQFDGTAKTPGVTSVIVDGKTLNAETDYEVSYSNNIYVGTATVTITFKGNYTGNARSATFTIVRAAAPAIQWPTAGSLTYGQKLSESTLTSEDANGTFAWENGEQIPTVTNSGYVVVYTPKDTVNYDYSGVTLTQTIPVTVSKAPASVETAPAANTLIYTGEAQALVTAGAANNGEMQYSTDNQTWSTAIPKGTNAGEYTVYYKVVGDANHIDTDVQSVVVKIGQLAVEEPTVSGTYTYTGEEQTAQLTGVESYMTVASGNKATNAGSYEVVITLDGNHKWADGSDGKVQWSIGKAQAQISVNTDPITVTYGETVTLPTAATNFGAVVCDKTAADLVNAGTYTVTYTVAGTDNFEGDTKSITVTVNAKAITVTAEAKSKTYGDADPKLTYTVVGLENNDALTGELKRAAGENVGAYAIEQGTLTAGNNYTITYTGAELTITAKAITKADVALDGSLTYTGEEQTQPITVTEGITYTVTGDKATDVGTYELTVKGTDNYTGEVKLSWSIKAAAATVDTAPKANNLTYTGEAQELITAGEAEGGTMQYQLNGGAWSASIPTAKDEGTYTVSWKVVGDANHADTEVKSITVTIGDCTHSGNTNKDDADCTTQITCSVCGDVLVESKAHVWGDWTTTMEPTTTTEGSKERLCTNDGCEAKDTDSIPMLNEVEVPEEIVGGDVSVDNPTPATGDDVTITVTPDTGKEVDEVIVTGKDGKEIPVTDNGDGTYTYEQPDGDVTVEVIIKDTIYTVTWIVDGTTYKTTQYKYGETITAPTDPTKAQSGCTTYTFDKWNGFTSGMTMPDNESLTFTAVFTEGESHIDENTNHICDRNCGKTDMGKHADGNLDHVCDYGCDVAIGEHKDANKDHACDYGCTESIGTCEDADKDHDCDYGCDKIYGEHTDADKNHICDYGCTESIGTCEDADKDHDCDYGCDKVYGEHKDTAGDGDHVCDYGCGETLTDCVDVDTDTDHKCDECGAAMPKDGTQVEIPADDTGTITPGAPAEIDGKPIVIDWDGEIWLEDKDSQLLVTYKFNEDADPHKEYPTAMYAWLLKWEGETCKAIRVPELDNFMTYKGTSIRINHSSDGIRFFTSVPVDTLNQAMKGTLLTGELEGYKLVEMGTLYKWAATGTELTVANGAKSYVYGGSAGSNYRQFSKEGSLSWFTGMLTDLPGDAATLAKDILSRPYAVFETADGDQITLYGGSVQRSIYYVALQNKDTWASGTAYDNYVEKIIATVEAANG